MSVNPAKHYNFTVSEYERMGETGIFPHDARVELIEGEIIEMSPIGSRHAAAVDVAARSLMQQTVEFAIVRIQNPIVLDDFSEPHPDITLLRFQPDFYRKAHPRPGYVLLIIEVADTTVNFDRQVKMPLYARAGIPEALLFNLPDDRLEYFSRPENGVYQETRVLGRGERFESTTVPGLTLEVEMILG